MDRATLTGFPERRAGLSDKPEQLGPQFLPPWAKFPEV